MGRSKGKRWVRRMLLVPVPVPVLVLMVLRTRTAVTHEEWHAFPHGHDEGTAAGVAVSWAGRAYHTKEGDGAVQGRDEQEQVEKAGDAPFDGGVALFRHVLPQDAGCTGVQMLADVGAVSAFPAAQVPAEQGRELNIVLGRNVGDKLLDRCCGGERNAWYGKRKDTEGGRRLGCTRGCCNCGGRRVGILLVRHRVDRAQCEYVTNPFVTEGLGGGGAHG